MKALFSRVQPSRASRESDLECTPTGKDVIMDQRTAVVFVGMALALLAGISAWFYMRHRRSRLLRERFGPEYERVVRQEGNVRRGKAFWNFAKKNAKLSTFVRSLGRVVLIFQIAGTMCRPNSWTIRKAP
jgi:hypothetical protein